MNKMKTPRATVAAVAGAQTTKAGEDLYKQSTLHSLLCQVSKRLIVWLAVRGLLPVAMADLLIRWGGLRHE